jgi:molecular chaperone DnaK
MKEVIISRNRLEGLLQNSQRSFSEFGWMLSAQDQEIVRNALEKAHAACASEDGDAIRAALETLEHSARMITDAMFKPASVSRPDDDDGVVEEGGTKALPEST